MWPRVIKATPIQVAPTYFTDGSINGKAGIARHEGWETLVMPHALAQQVELGAVITVLASKDKTLINIVSDSAYIFGMTNSIETAKIKHVNSEKLFLLFLRLQKSHLFLFLSFLYYTYLSSLPHPGASHPWQFSG